MPRVSDLKSRFFWKTYSTFALLFLATTLLVTWICFSRISTTVRTMILDNLHAQAEYLVPHARALLTGTEKVPDELTKELGQATGTRITIIDATGKVISESEKPAAEMENHWERPEIQEALVEPYGFAERTSMTFGTPFFYLARAIKQPDGKVIGVVRVSLSPEKIHNELSSLRLTMAVIAMAGVVIALILGWTLTRRVTVPIREMVQVAEALRNGKYEQKVKTITDDELGRLGDTLNRLGSELTSKISELHRLETVRRDFVANVSHEIKTPLTSIKGYVETLLSGAINEPDLRLRFLEKIERNSERLTNLVQDLLSLAKIEAAEDSLKLMAIDWSEIVSSVLMRNEDAINKRQLRVKVNMPSIPPVVLGDPEAMTQVLDNLLTNAIKYTPGEGRITLTLVVRGGICKLSVADTGIGIPAEHLDRIFERFYRVDKARSRELGGTGLGLSIVKHLVSAMGGEVQVVSTVGEGSTFTVKLKALA